MKQRGKKKKELKEMRKTSETSGTVKSPNIRIIGVQVKKTNRKAMRKYLRR